MNENNFTIKATARNQGLAQSDGVFNQHKFISDIYECEKQEYILKRRLNELFVKKQLVLQISRKILKNLFSIKIIAKNLKRKNHFLNYSKNLILFLII